MLWEAKALKNDLSGIMVVEPLVGFRELTLAALDHMAPAFEALELSLLDKIVFGDFF